MLLYRFCSVLLFRFLRAISKYKPPGAYIRRGDLTEGFLLYEFEGLIHGGAYFWRYHVCTFHHPQLLKKVSATKFTSKDSINNSNSNNSK